MKNIKRKVCELLIAALFFTSLPFTGMLQSAAEPDPAFYKATISEYTGETPKYYTELTTCSSYFTDRNGETRYRVLGSFSKGAEPQWFPADQDGEPIGTEPVATTSEYNDLAPYEYEILNAADYTDEIWQKFFTISSNSIYCTPSGAGKTWRTEYTPEFYETFSSDVLSYEEHYDGFGAWKITGGKGTEDIEYVAYGRILNDGTSGEMGWLFFANPNAWTFIVKYEDESGNVLDGYPDGIRGAVAKTGVEIYPVNITGYSPKKTSETVDSDGKEILFVYTPNTCVIKNYIYGDGSAPKDKETTLTYNDEPAGFGEASAHAGYTLKAYKVK